MERLTLNNGVLAVEISPLGAEVKSLIKNGVEYLWQGVEKFWSGQAPNLFPIVGRLRDGKYLHNGKEYELGCHGFARKQVFSVESQTENKIVFVLTENEETKKVYPFNFIFKVIYTLDGDTLTVDYQVENPAEEDLYFGVGAHPGFNVPLNNGTFSDYYLEFSAPSNPKAFVCSARSLFCKDLVPFTLKDGKKLVMTKEQWIESGGVYLDGTPDTVTLKSDIYPCSVSVKSNMRYTCFWSAPNSNFICIEPWESIPDIEKDEGAGEISQKESMIKLSKGETFTKFYSITVK